MFEYPYLLPTFAGLRSLKTLGITVLGEQCGHEMMSWSSSSQAFNYHRPTQPLDLSAHAASHPILMLKQSAASLTELSHCDCLLDASPGLTFSPQKVVYPKVHTLRLGERFTLNRIPQAFVRAFPNHVSFHMESAPPPPPPREPIDTRPFQIQRDVTLGLQHPSQHGQDTPALRPPFALTAILAYAQSTHLTITFENRLLTYVLGGGFLDALRSDSASGLRSLAFIIDLMAADRDDGNLDIDHALDDVAAGTAHGLQLAVADVLLGWQVASGIVMLPKSVTPARIKANIEGAIAASKKLTPEDIEKLNGVVASGKEVRLIQPPWGVDLGFENWRVTFAVL